MPSLNSTSAPVGPDAEVVRFTTYGAVRGQCGHVHGTYAHAARCLASDGAACHSQGGYSDRAVVVIGEDGLLYRDLACEVPVWPSHGRSSGAVVFYRRAR